jgi:hypothetical protein
MVFSELGSALIDLRTKCVWLGRRIADSLGLELTDEEAGAGARG